MPIFIISVQSVKNCETKITYTSQYCVSEHKEDFCPHVCELGYNTVIVTPSFQTKKIIMTEKCVFKFCAMYSD